jgi:UDP-N-acetylmuramate: L-alanyl-gamma-D-glutamyl-meso-diaminopimelate ligase
MSIISNLKKGDHIHLMGICGTAMASLAGLLQDRGFKITGSDSNPYPPMSTQLESLGIPVMRGYAAKNLHPQPKFVIVGNVISANNEEAQELIKLGLPYTSLPKAMGEFIIENRESIVVAGTHGKTTTTSLMSWVAQTQGVKPGFLIGGIPKNFSKSFQNPEGNYFVIEGDEYDTAFFDKVPKFVHYRPKHVILTSIEFDHADIYADLNAVKAAFAKLMELLPKEGTLVFCAEEKNVVETASKTRAAKKISYGIESGEYQARITEMSESGTRFELLQNGKSTGRTYQMKMGGRYNVLNALAVIAMSDALGFASGKTSEALATFEGVKRRQEVLGEPGGVLVIEDFAHHPTAVRETVKGIQAKYPGRRFFSVFEPRSATSRRKVFQRDYVEAFSEAHEILIAKAFDQSKIDEGNRFSSEELIEDLKKRGKSAKVFDSADQIVADLVERSRPGDGILIMSNGGFDGIYQKLLSALSSRK